jgi:hypothetical protein
MGYHPLFFGKKGGMGVNNVLNRSYQTMTTRELMSAAAIMMMLVGVPAIAQANDYEAPAAAEDAAVAADDAAAADEATTDEATADDEDTDEGTADEETTEEAPAE